MVGGAAQREVDPGGRPSTDVELDSGLVVGRQTLVADSNTGLSQETKDNALAEPVVRMSERVDWPAFVVTTSCWIASGGRRCSTSWVKRLFAGLTTTGSLRRAARRLSRRRRVARRTKCGLSSFSAQELHWIHTPRGLFKPSDPVPPTYQTRQAFFATGRNRAATVRYRPDWSPGPEAGTKLPRGDGSPTPSTGVCPGRVGRRVGGEWVNRTLPCVVVRGVDTVVGWQRVRGSGLRRCWVRRAGAGRSVLAEPRRRGICISTLPASDRWRFRCPRRKPGSCVA